MGNYYNFKIIQSYCMRDACLGYLNSNSQIITTETTTKIWEELERLQTKREPLNKGVVINFLEILNLPASIETHFESLQRQNLKPFVFEFMNKLNPVQKLKILSEIDNPESNIQDFLKQYPNFYDFINNMNPQLFQQLLNKKSL